MKFTHLLLFCALLCSCQKKSEVTYNGKRVSIRPTDSGITKVSNVVWKVGKLRNIDISKGIQVSFSLPQFDKKDLHYLIDNFDVDSWVIKVKRKGLMKNEVVGYLSIPITLPGQNSSMRIKQIKSGSFQILYSAASVGSRFANLPCPVFNHDLKIQKIELGKDKSSASKMSVSQMEEERLLVRVEEYSYSGTSLNGGKSLRGNYHVEMAFYNKIKKVKLSNFIELNGSANIIREKSIPVIGCDNFTIPSEVKEGGGIKSFKWTK